MSIKRLVPAALAVTIAGAVAQKTGASEVVMTQVTSQRFSVVSAGIGFPFRPFDTSLGDLQSVNVQGQTVFGTAGNAFPFGVGGAYPISLQVDINATPTASSGLDFVGPWTYTFPQAGIGPSTDSNIASLPVGAGGLQTFSFTIDQAADTAGIAPINWTSQLAGAAVSPSLVNADFGTFTAPTAGLGSQIVVNQTVTSSGNVVMNPPTFGGSMFIQYNYIPRGLGPEKVNNGDFDNGLNGWETTGPGEATTTSDNVGQDNTAAQLTTSSPVTLSQSVETPASDFRVQFDYAFLTADGTLDVGLESQVLASLTSPLDFDLPDVYNAQFERFSYDVSDVALQDLNDALLELRFDGPADSQVLIDNVSLAAVPEPTTLALLALPAGLVLGRPRRDRHR